MAPLLQGLEVLKHSMQAEVDREGSLETILDRARKFAIEIMRYPIRPIKIYSDTIAKRRKSALYLVCQWPRPTK